MLASVQMPTKQPNPAIRPAAKNGATPGPAPARPDRDAITSGPSVATPPGHLDLAITSAISNRRPVRNYDAGARPAITPASLR